VLLRDQPAIADLVQFVRGQLVQARGGAEPLLATLDAYFSSGVVATETARLLHLSVRAVTYRLDRVRTLTGYDPTAPPSGSPSPPRHPPGCLRDDLGVPRGRLQQPP
jgi:DNA-binding PucR family transcriptional regulator